MSWVSFMDETSTTDKKADEVFSREDANELTSIAGHCCNEHQTRVAEILIIV